MAKMSKLEERVKAVLEEVFPYHELTFNYSIGKGYKIDFMLHGLYDIAIECHGEQHFKYVDHFHKDAGGWLDQLRRDEEKFEKIMELGYPYVEIYFDDPINKNTLLHKIGEAIDLFEGHTSAEANRRTHYYSLYDVRQRKRKDYFMAANVKQVKEK